MIRLTKQLLRMTLQMALLPLFSMYMSGSIAAFFLTPIYFFKFGTGTGAEWDGFTLLALIDGNFGTCSYGSGFTNWLSSAHLCRLDTVEPWLRASLFSPESQIAGVVQIADGIFGLNLVLGFVFVAIALFAVEALLPNQID